jgi:hypothetical protein
MIIERFNPEYIYQWGSLLDKKMFTDYSDIDIALEGIRSIEDMLELENHDEVCFPYCAVMDETVCLHGTLKVYRYLN